MLIFSTLLLVLCSTLLPVSKHQALNDSLAKAKSRSKHWEREAKADAEKIKGVDKEMEEAKQEAKIS